MRYLIDADVVIDTLRRHPDAHRFVRNHESGIVVSVLTIAELYAGVRLEKEEEELVGLLSLFSPIGVSESVAKHGGLYRKRYGRSHGTGIIDAMIAATAEEEKLTLVTLNKKHYPMLKNVMVPYKKG